MCFLEPCETARGMLTEKSITLGAETLFCTSLCDGLLRSSSIMNS